MYKGLSASKDVAFNRNNRFVQEVAVGAGGETGAQGYERTAHNQVEILSELENVICQKIQTLDS